MFSELCGMRAANEEWLKLNPSVPFTDLSLLHCKQPL